MKIKRYNEINESIQYTDEQIKEMMEKGVECDKYIEDTGTILGNLCSDLVQPYIENEDWDGAKQITREFFKDARRKIDGEGDGDVVFIEYDLMFARINRAKNDKN